LPVRDRTPEDEQPLARPVNEQSLARPAGGEQEDVAQAKSHQAEQEQTTSQAEEASQGVKGPVTRIVDKAQENNWVYGSVAEKARENGLLDKADELLARARNRLGGG
jgi:outer membrane biosynthesis protein TonB